MTFEEWWKTIRSVDWTPYRAAAAAYAAGRESKAEELKQEIKELTAELERWKWKYGWIVEVYQGRAPQ